MDKFKDFITEAKVKVKKQAINVEEFADYPYRDILIDEKQRLIYAVIYTKGNDEFGDAFDKAYNKELKKVTEEYKVTGVKDIYDDKDNYMRATLFEY
jgi:hypothetical protein